MREIKFRAKRLDNGEWVNGSGLLVADYFCVIDRDTEMYVDEKYEWAGNTHFFRVAGAMCELKTLGQYTGLKDKNGKEIYEGDILRGDEYPFNCDGVDNYFAEIVWADNVCGFYRITHKKPNSTVRGISHGNWEQLDEDDIKSFEVIGNIYDNPKLINKEYLEE